MVKGTEKDQDVYSTALASIEDGVMILNEHSQMEFSNAAADRTFDLKPAEGRGRTFIEVVRDYEFDVLLRRSRTSGRREETVIKTRQKKRLLKVTIVPRADRPGFVVVIHDLTERQHLEEIRRDLISNISHEFRTPIASIKLLAETLIRGAMEDHNVATEFLGKIDVEAEKLAQMTDELSLLSTFESRESVLGRGEADISRLIGQTVERLSPQAQKREVSIEVRTEPALPHLVIDKDRIESVLVNLIHNAIKFTDKGGAINISAQFKDGSIVISVADTGIGIPQEELPRIFERFYKVDKSRAGEGSGLGLAISKHIVLAHGGKIWADSREGKGSTFYVTLPLGT